MIETVKMFDYWAFHDDGSVQFFQILNGEIFDYQYYNKPEDAPVFRMRPDIRYHGRSYEAPKCAVLNE